MTAFMYGPISSHEILTSVENIPCLTLSQNGSDDPEGGINNE